MAADDNTGGDTGLADAIRGPLDAGDLEAALRAARTFHMRHPGDPSAKRGVEALELLMSQVWLGSSDDDEAIGAAAKALEAGRIAEAHELYRGLLARTPNHERAHRLAHRTTVVVAILEGQPLPPPESSQARVEVAHMDFEDSTRVAGAEVIDRLRSEGEALASTPAPSPGLHFDDVTTAAPDAVIPGEAFGDGGFSPERTRHLSIGDYEVVEDGDAAEGADALEVPAPPPLNAAAEASADPDPTLDVVGSAQPPPLEKRRRKKKRSVPVEFKETTRVAGPGELPLDQLRREIEAEQSDQLDAFLGDFDEEDDAAPAAADEAPEPSAAGPVVPPPPGPVVPPPPAPPAPLQPTSEPKPLTAIEASLQLDITVVPDLLGAIEAEAAPAPAAPSGPPPPAPAPHPAAGPMPSEPAAPSPDAPSATAAPAPDDAAPEATEAPVDDLPVVLEPSFASELPPPLEDPPEPAPPEPEPAPLEVDSAPPVAEGAPRSLVVPPPPSGPPVPAPPIPPSPARRERDDATVQTVTGEDAAPRRSAPPLMSAPAPHVDAGPPPNDRISALPSEPAPPPVDVGDVHAPVDTSEISLSQAPPSWEEPTDPGSLETSWAGVRVFDVDPPAFAAGTEGVDADRWDDMSAPGEVPPPPVLDEEERAAQQLVESGKLRDALRAYQDLAAKRPSEQRLWDMVAHVARLLQERSK